jgi:hypothetical protein
MHDVCHARYVRSTHVGDGVIAVLQGNDGIICNAVEKSIVYVI